MNEGAAYPVSQREQVGTRSRLLDTVLGGLAFLYLACSILCLNLLQVVSLAVWPISRHAFYSINEGFAQLWWGSIVVLMESVSGIRLHFSGDDLPSHTNSILISNHQGMSDIPALFCLAWRKKRLFALKWFVKDAFKYVPGAGWGMLFLNNVFVKRDWLRDQKSIARVFANLRSRKRPFWLVSFLEGTRLTADKVAKSQAYCQSKNLPVFRHVLAPRTKGFAASLAALRDEIDGVYDVTIGFPGGAPNLFGLFIGRCKDIHFYVRRFEKAALPQAEQDINAWVWERYREKDQLLHHFVEQGHFPA